MLIRTVLVLLFLISGNVSSKGKVYFGMLSYHYDRGSSLNEVHKNIGYESENGYFVEYFKNSHRKDTFFIGKFYRDIYKFENNWSFGTDIGLVKGYNFRGESVSVLGFPTVSYSGDDYGVDIRFGYTEVVAVRFFRNF